MKKRIISLLKQLKKDRKYIIIAADKNLGPCILDIEFYISRCLGDHLDNTDIYEEVSPIDAMLIQENNFRWICEHFIDTANEIPILDRKSFKETLVGDRDGWFLSTISKRFFCYFFKHVNDVFNVPLGIWRVPQGNHLQFEIVSIVGVFRWKSCVFQSDSTLQSLEINRVGLFYSHCYTVTQIQSQCFQNSF